MEIRELNQPQRSQRSQRYSFKDLLSVLSVSSVALIFFFFFILSKQASAVPTTRPNVLFIISDDLSTLALPLYGNHIVHTPNIDRLAARGVRFERAYCNYPLCLPSRNSFLSGLRPDDRFGHGDILRHYIPDVEFLPEHFRKNGYYTSRLGKIFHTRTIFNGATTLDDPECWDHQDLCGIPIDPCGYSVVYSNFPKGLPAHPQLQQFILDEELLNKAGNPAYDYWMDRTILKDGTDTIDASIARHTIDELEAHVNGTGAGATTRPFFIATGFRRPHLLWVAPEQNYKLYDPDKIVLPDEPPRDPSVPKQAYTRGTKGMSDEMKKKAIASYYACVTHMDHQLGLVLDCLDKNHLWDNTIVVFTSDHGWHLDTHGGLFGKVTLFQEAARVPLIICAPGLKPGISPRTVEMVDLFPTLSEMANLPAPRHVDGTSVVPLLDNPDAPRDKPAFCVLRRGKVWGKAINTEDFRYTEWGDDADKGAELYELKADPHEFKNLASDPAHAQIREKLKQQLRETVHVKDTDASEITSQ